jgi:SAM-dependent methyltransferase
MHTLYWHPEPRALLDACRRALRPDGRAVFLTYARRASVARTFRDIRARDGLGAAVEALRWLVPTAAFERFRDCEPRYLSRGEFHAALEQSGFQVLESRDTFLAGISLLVWARPRGARAGVPQGSDPAHAEETRA